MTRARQSLHFHMTTVAIAAIAIVIGSIPEEASSRPGGGGRGAATSVQRGGGAGMHAGGAAARPNINAGGNRNAINRGGDRNQINRGGDRINTGNINIGNDVNIDVDHDWDHNGWDYHPVARGVAFGAAAAVTSAMVGSMIYSLPPSCSTVVYTGVSYSRCGSVWYQPQYAGSSVTYVVVNPPY